MKKIIFLVLAMIMLVSIVGCGQTEPVNNSSTTTTESTTLEKPTGEVSEENSTSSEVNTTIPDETSIENNTKESITQSKQTTTTTKDTTTTKKGTATKPTASKTTTTKAKTTTTKAKTTTTKAKTTTTKAGNIALEKNTQLRFSDKMLKVINDEFLRLVNNERTKSGVQPLTVNSTLMSAANKRAGEILQYYSHTRPNGQYFSSIFKESNYKYNFTNVSENIGKFYSIKNSGLNLEINYTNEELKAIAKDFFNEWKNSPDHYKNMIAGKYTETGFYFSNYYNEANNEIGIVAVHILGDR